MGTAWNQQHSCYVTLLHILQADTNASSASSGTMYKSCKQNTDLFYTTNMNKPKSPTRKYCSLWEPDRADSRTRSERDIMKITFTKEIPHGKSPDGNHRLCHILLSCMVFVLSKRPEGQEVLKRQGKNTQREKLAILLHFRLCGKKCRIYVFIYSDI